ncbi:hypothetical protein GCM10023080_017250 [Streptomyces pseudoechinosporeus]
MPAGASMRRSGNEEEARSSTACLSNMVAVMTRTLPWAGLSRPGVVNQPRTTQASKPVYEVLSVSPGYSWPVPDGPL